MHFKISRKGLVNINPWLDKSEEVKETLVTIMGGKKHPNWWSRERG